MTALTTGILSDTRSVAGATVRPAQTVDAPRRNELKRAVHGQLIDRLNLGELESTRGEPLRMEIRRLVNKHARDLGILLNEAERDRLAADVLDETFGYGPLEALLNDDTVCDILVNSPRQVFVERNGVMEESDIQFRDEAHLMHVIERMVTRVGRRIDESSPMVDARLSDGSRINAIIAPLSLSGPVLSIRRFGRKPLAIEDLLRLGALTEEMSDFLAAAVCSRLSIAISGGTGTGKTTLLNTLSAYIPQNERIITIEDSAELILRQKHVVRLETRPPNIEGKGEITQRDLVRNSLRMRPDRIILGEVRGVEALDMLQAMNTGHEGSLTTIHANSPRDALSRIETMVAMTGLELPVRAVRQQVASAIRLIIQVARLAGGARRVVSITEIVGMEQDIVSMQDLFQFRQEGVRPNGSAHGQFVATGIRPRCLDLIERAGRALPSGLFQPRTLRSVDG